MKTKSHPNECHIEGREANSEAASNARNDQRARAPVEEGKEQGGVPAENEVVEYQIIENFEGPQMFFDTPRRVPEGIPGGYERRKQLVEQHAALGWHVGGIWWVRVTLSRLKDSSEASFNGRRQGIRHPVARVGCLRTT